MECKELKIIISELEEYAVHIDDRDITKMTEEILAARRIFVAGAGRSGFAARGFANRLMHLGFLVYFVGEPTTPSIHKDDLLIIGSGSGTTESLVAMAHKAKSKEARIATLTIFPEHTIGTLSGAVIKIPGATSKKEAGDHETAVTRQPMGSLFEQLCWLTYDSIVMRLKEKLDETDEAMFKRHANLE